jgi:hypothetical protein
MNELAILSALILKHLICDYPLQRPYQFLNKGIYGHPGGLLHVAIHAIGTLIMLSFISSLLAAIGLALLDAFIHYHIDWTKDHISSHSTSRMGKPYLLRVNPGIAVTLS